MEGAFALRLTRHDPRLRAPWARRGRRAPGRSPWTLRRSARPSSSEVSRGPALTSRPARHTRGAVPAQCPLLAPRHLGSAEPGAPRAWGHPLSACPAPLTPSPSRSHPGPRLALHLLRAPSPVRHAASRPSGSLGSQGPPVTPFRSGAPLRSPPPAPHRLSALRALAPSRVPSRAHEASTPPIHWVSSTFCALLRAVSPGPFGSHPQHRPCSVAEWLHRPREAQRPERCDWSLSGSPVPPLPGPSARVSTAPAPPPARATPAAPGGPPQPRHSPLPAECRSPRSRDLDI